MDSLQEDRSARREMTNKRVVIIGAGLSGLAAGCYARMNDHQATIFDQLGWPGGLARSWNREGFRMDPGPDLIWGHEPGTSTHSLLRELGVFPKKKISPVRWEVIDEKGLRRIDLPWGNWRRSSSASPLLTTT
jgi:phytoene desaturase